jgi:alpha/beta superfamily hydrolase
MTMSAEPPGETIVPVFFGQDSILYGCYHLPPDYRHRPGVLICQPTGHEYERCHRAMRQLAVQSAKKGLSAMRFDYYATGDSAGNCEELSLARMRLDIQRAIQHCCDKTGVKQLTLVGVRLGATLAAQLASSCCEIESLVLYAPVFDGEALFNEWQRDQQAFHDKHSYQLQQAGANEILGFTVPGKFQSELRRNFDPAAPGRALKRVLILTDETDSNSELVNRWVEMFNHQAIEVTLEIVENIAIWRREPMEAIVPVKTIRRIVKWIGEGQDA